MYRAVIFDLDGTLLNTLTDLANSGNHTLRVLGFAPHPIDAYRTMIGSGVPKLVERFLPEHARGEATQEMALSIYLKYYAEHKSDTTAPYEGIVALLAQLRAHGVQLGVVSNKEDSLTKAVCAQYFGDAFDGVAGHVIGTQPKPNPDGVNRLRAQFGTTCAQTLYVGDSDIDMFTAGNAGLDACGVTWGFRSQEELQGAGATFFAHSASDIFNRVCTSGNATYFDGQPVATHDAVEYEKLRAHCISAVQTALAQHCAHSALVANFAEKGACVVGYAQDGMPNFCVSLHPSNVLAMGEAMANNTFTALIDACAII